MLGAVNVVHCPCGHSWQFRGASPGLITYVQAPGATAWRYWGLWPSTIEKFRCRCKKHLRLR